MRAHLLVVNKRGESLVDGEVADFGVVGESIFWTTRRVLGEGHEDHEHELDIHEVATLSWTARTQDSSDQTLI